MRNLLLVTAIVALTASTFPADARSRRAPAGAEPQSTGSVAYPQRYPGRGYDLYSRPVGAGGSIQWNSPNASGNLGGPGTGGGGAT